MKCRNTRCEAEAEPLEYECAKHLASIPRPPLPYNPSRYDPVDDHAWGNEDGYYDGNRGCPRTGEES